MLEKLLNIQISNSNNHEMKRKKKREKSKLHAEISAFKLFQLSPNTEDALIHNAQHGHITMVILLLEGNSQDAKASPIYKSFASIMYIHRYVTAL